MLKFLLLIVLLGRSFAFAGPLHDSAYQGDIAKINYLLANGEKPKINEHDKIGMTPLMYAAIKGHLDAFFALIDGGANVDIKDIYYEGVSAIWYAPKYLNLADKIRNHGASDQSCDKSGDLDKNYAFHIEKNEFNIKRGFCEYFGYFSNILGFLEFAKTLANARVLDAGSGECNLAREWLGMEEFSQSLNPDHDVLPQTLSMILEPSAQPFITAITFRLDKKIKSHERLKILTGALFSNIQDKDIGEPHSFKLIFDFFGIASYSVDFVTVLNRYLGLLAKDGNIAMITPSVIVKTLSKNISIKKWLKEKGLTVISSHRIVLIQNPDNIILPSLKLIELLDSDESNLALSGKIYEEEQEMKSSLEMHGINQK